MNSRPAVRGSQEAGFTQPCRVHLIALLSLYLCCTCRRENISLSGLVLVGIFVAFLVTVFYSYVRSQLAICSLKYAQNSDSAYLVTVGPPALLPPPFALISRCVKNRTNRKKGTRTISSSLRCSSARAAAPRLTGLLRSCAAATVLRT